MPSHSTILTQSYLKSALHYDPETGKFTWRHRDDRSPQWNGRCAGKECGWIVSFARSRTSYRQITMTVSGYSRPYLAHRLAWLYMTGKFPSTGIDHRDRDGLNNRWSNLRLADQSENACNSHVRQSKTGIRGVRMYGNGRFGAYIRKHGKQEHLGTFQTAQEASQAYQKAAQRLHGEFAHESEVRHV